MNSSPDTDSDNQQPTPPSPPSLPPAYQQRIDEFKSSLIQFFEIDRRIDSAGGYFLDSYQLYLAAIAKFDKLHSANIAAINEVDHLRTGTDAVALRTLGFLQEGPGLPVSDMPAAHQNLVRQLLVLERPPIWNRREIEKLWERRKDEVTRLAVPQEPDGDLRSLYSSVPLGMLTRDLNVMGDQNYDDIANLPTLPNY